MTRGRYVPLSETGATFGTHAAALGVTLALVNMNIITVSLAIEATTFTLATAC